MSPELRSTRKHLCVGREKFTIMMQIDSAMLKLEKELGFTPLARMRAPAREEPEKSNVFNAFE